MKKQFEQVQEFNEAFGVEPIALGLASFASQYKQECLLRHKLMAEENNEYLTACANGDRVEIADALGDQLYILIGTMIKHGFTHELIERVFDEIHYSNKSKLDLDGTPILREDGKVMKGPNYFKPQIKSILDNYEGQ